MKLRFLDLTTTDPAFNLAAEEYVFEKLPRDSMYVMLWQNDNAIIVGKHQNTLAQINEAFVREKGIKVVRRLSGGGAVYHDMGNLNYTIIADGDGDLDFGRFCRIVLDALARVGVKGELNGRNDMTIDGKKFSGNAQYAKQGRVMHHGTILFDSDSSVLAGALQVDEEKIKAKGVKSVRSRVTNVRPHLPKDMPLKQFKKVLLGSILTQFPGEEYIFTPGDIAEIEKLSLRYRDWEWNYGKSPACDLVRKQRVEGCGTVEIYMVVDQGRIQQVQFRGDFFSAREPEGLAQRLVGLPLERQALAAALLAEDVGSFFMGLDAAGFLDILCE
ncbi:MAG: lipoate--protein ligase [Oscillospiraceae bacterium]|nr:lipoate--protein ligase [Oscillospiraceae bacterium]